jgi:hypothetical protein
MKVFEALLEMKAHWDFHFGRYGDATDARGAEAPAPHRVSRSIVQSGETGAAPQSY